MIKTRLVLFLPIVFLVLLTEYGTLGYAQPQQIPLSNFKVAFIGDQGLGPNSVSVLQLIKDEGADMVLHQGDFDYTDNPDAWDQQINDILGSGFPYFASIGNHDVVALDGYQQKLNERLTKITGANCSGDLGVKSSCTYQGLFFILSGAGTMGSGHDTFIKDQLLQDNSIWRICSWHKNMNAMQVGEKPDETGWEVYEECRKGGAIIATGHEHSYVRTKTLTSIENQIVDPDFSDPNNLRVSKGSTFVFVSALGGQSIRNQDRCLPTTFPYGCNNEWASIYTSDQGAKYGALFCTFNVDAQPNKANCYFKDISGNVPDQFSITVESCLPPSSGDWIITSSCTLNSSTTAPANVIVQNNSVLTIPAGLTFDIDFVNFNLTVKSGSGVLIKAGGTIT